MTNDNLYCLLKSRFPNDPADVFLESPVSDDPGGDTLSYGEADALSARMAAGLRALDVNPGDRVVVQVEKSAEAVVLYLACLRVGAIYIPLNTAYTAAELAYFLGDAEPQLLVCEPEKNAALRAVCDEGGVPHLLCLDASGKGSWMDHVGGFEADPDIAERDKDDTAAILYTSGTTGRSKGAMLSHDNLASNALTLHELWGFQPGDVLLHALPIYHVHGLFVALHCAMLNGSKAWFLPRFEIGQVLDLLPRSTVMMGVPTFYVRLLGDARFTKELCANMRLFIAGSAPLLAETFDSFEERTGQRILERYGMTEAGMITSNPYDPNDGERLAGTVGFALPGVEARVCSDDGVEIPRGETGVLEIKGPNVFKGYWRNEEKTAAEFRDDGFFITGDMSVMDDEGRVTIVGRAKDLVISGGFNVYPKEVEGEIDLIEGVVESAVIGLPHPDFGEGVTAVVVPEPAAALTPEDINGHLADKLAKFKQPKRIFFVDSLPRNAMGKVQKKELRERYADTYQ